jgi:uncharacterized protein YecT (DUF1311 family)
MRLFLFLLVATPAFAQYQGPAVDTCLAHAKREAPNAKDVVFERDQSLQIERYTRKLGTQLVSSILRGNGAVVLDGSPGAELSFVCLLADDKRAVYFEWLARPNAPALPQCTRDPGLKTKGCLEHLLVVAELDLTQVAAMRFQESRERADAAGNESSVMAFRKADDEWRQYRDAECARRREHAPKGVAPEDYQLACILELTRRRALDMR